MRFSNLVLCMTGAWARHDDIVHVRTSMRPESAALFFVVSWVPGAARPRQGADQGFYVRHGFPLSRTEAKRIYTDPEYVAAYAVKSLPRTGLTSMR
jgi:hypothetical protein